MPEKEEEKQETKQAKKDMYQITRNVRYRGPGKFNDQIIIPKDFKDPVVLDFSFLSEADRRLLVRKGYLKPVKSV